MNFPCHNGKLNKIVQTWIYIWHVKEELIFNLSSWNLHPDIVVEVITPRNELWCHQCTLIRFFHYYYFSFSCIDVRLGTIETFNTCMAYEIVYHDLKIYVFMNSNFEEKPYTFIGQFAWLKLIYYSKLKSVLKGIQILQRIALCELQSS